MSLLHMNRRNLLKGVGATLAAPTLLRATRASAQEAVFKIGYVSPNTGPIAGFAEADAFILEGVRKAFAGLTNNGKPVRVEIITKDSQSSSNRAAEVATELIENDGVNMLLASAAPDTANPVADQAELNEIPCITSISPWQPYFFGRNGDPSTGFQWTYHFFWGLEDVIANFLALWEQSGAAKKVGGLFPNDADGNAWGDPKVGLPPALADAGYSLVDPGRYQVMNNDFSSQIAAFKQAGCEVVTGNMIPPDFATFWSQAGQQGFSPKVVSIGKALLFPSVIQSLGDRGDGLTTEIWWTPSHPFSSSLTGESAKTIATTYEASTGKQWTQPIGFNHALFEVAADVIKRAADLSDPKSVVDALASTDMKTIVGPISWKGGSLNPVKNVVRTPLVGGQWQKQDDRFELVITNNSQYPSIPVGGELKVLS
ncbi:ABC transporter substrate-binding protein [Rhizobium leguminosarum]|uniref:ABC transporter substrate-binding protein n=1 Tax=Rhizobium leguminosarum TaxID=384 RepID=UPI001F241591|nr:ABC transporter substrate-binding protein [Rhizobium leguminosarum]UIJ83200.1 ABC transporter substrate-binding protein [Rhizobium leguminosarum]